MEEKADVSPIAMSCRLCGAPMNPDPAELRRAIANCPSCGTIQRLTADEAPTKKERAGVRDDVPGVRIERVGDELRIYCKPLQGVSETYGREMVIGGVVALLLVPVFGCPILPLFIGLVVAVFAGAVRKEAPPLVVDTVSLRIPGALSQRVIQKNSIKQFFCTNSGPGLVSMPGSEGWAMLYALNQDGTRQFIFGPLSSHEAGLRVEELIELHFDIADRPVFGESVRKQDQAPSREAALAESVDVDRPHERECDCCGALQNLSDASWTRGFTRCEYCKVLTVHEPAGSGKVLGRSEAIDDELRFEMQDDALLLRLGTKPVAVLQAQGLSISGTFHKWSEVRGLRLKLDAHDSDLDSLQTKSLVSVARAWTHRAGYSGGASAFDHAIGLRDCELFAQMKNGAENSLLVGRTFPLEASGRFLTLSETFGLPETELNLDGPGKRWPTFALMMKQGPL
jgi:hypothetical protein